MTVSLCIRHGWKRNDDSVSVEELDWSAERHVLIPAEHLWCDFKYRPWAKNSSLNTINLYIHYMDTSTGTPPSLEEKKALPNCGNKDGNIIHVFKNVISTSVATVLKRMKCLYPYVIGVWWWIFGSKSPQKATWFLLFYLCLVKMIVLTSSLPWQAQQISMFLLLTHIFIYYTCH